ncbi:hypothetical protein EDD18DRAFT_1116600 [Armillaria luteobubalina]|uniref:Uncharacterized protein n=1 Tax=Armillaria luteobubalina TaxID=153913 RepID=A0AA39NZN4_9AGAR|nr:hypothetical protein EDD18DRAFT_1116600 [Armillaria luteobubalina]
MYSLTSTTGDAKKRAQPKGKMGGKKKENAESEDYEVVFWTKIKFASFFHTRPRERQGNVRKWSCMVHSRHMGKHSGSFDLPTTISDDLDDARATPYAHISLYENAGVQLLPHSLLYHCLRSSALQLSLQNLPTHVHTDAPEVSGKQEQYPPSILTRALNLKERVLDEANKNQWLEETGGKMRKGRFAAPSIE